MTFIFMKELKMNIIQAFKHLSENFDDLLAKNSKILGVAHTPNDPEAEFYIIELSLDEDAKKEDTATVTVDEDQLSLAIGREGQNVRLAWKLTGFKIDIVGNGINKVEEKEETPVTEENVTEETPAPEEIVTEEVPAAEENVTAEPDTTGEVVEESPVAEEAPTKEE